MAYDNTNTFILSKNKRKEKETHPNLSGSINIDGVEYWLSGWTKEKNGEKYINGTVKRKEAKPEKRPEPQTESPEFDDDIPF